TCMNFRASTAPRTERRGKSVLGDGIVDDWNTLGMGERICARAEVLPHVDDPVGTAVGLGRCGLIVGPAAPVIVTPSARIHWHAIGPTRRGRGMEHDQFAHSDLACLLQKV